MKDRLTKRLETIFRVSGNVILAVSMIAALIWVLSENGILFPDNLNLEPYLALLGLVYATVPLLGQWVINQLDRDLRRERLTVAYALAYGYLNNYLAPVVRRLRKDLEDPNKLEFLVYIPDFLSELYSSSVDELLVELENQAYKVETVELDFPAQRRRRDFRTAKKAPQVQDAPDSVVYFDFPTTLLVLEKAVEYKIDTREDSFIDKQRERLELQYINDFREQLESMLNTRQFQSIRPNIKLVDGGIDFISRSRNGK